MTTWQLRKVFAVAAAATGAIAVIATGLDLTIEGIKMIFTSAPYPFMGGWTDMAKDTGLGIMQIARLHFADVPNLSPYGLKYAALAFGAASVYCMRQALKNNTQWEEPVLRPRWLPRL